MKIIQMWFAGVLLACCLSCSNSVDFGEQYKKQIYIVKGNEQIVVTEHMLTEKTDGFVTFYCSGSELPDKDIVVHYALDEEALNKYNESEYGEENTSLYLQCLPEDVITFESQTVTIKAGEEYAMLRFSINTSGLDPAVNYVMPISITQVSEYEISPSVKTLFYMLKLSTQYAGTYNSRLEGYNMFSLKYTKSVQKKVTATGKYQIKVPLMENKEVADGSISYLLVTLNPEDNSVTVVSEDPDYTPQEGYTINGEYEKMNYYLPEEDRIVICYSYGTGAWWDIYYVVETLDHISEL